LVGDPPAPDPEVAPLVEDLTDEQIENLQEHFPVWVEAHCA
jgi:hypothetical protein